MKRLNNKTYIFAKRVMTFLICSSILISASMAPSFVNATEADSSNQNQGTSGSAESTNIDPNGTLGKNSDIGIEVTKSITATVCKKIKVEFKLKSNDKANIKLKSVYPVIDNAFPFETSGDAYKIISAGSDAAKQENLDASFSLTARSDISAGYQSVRFIGEYTKTASNGTASDYYVIKTINIYFSEGSSGGSSGGSSQNAQSNQSDDSDDDSDYSSYDDSDDSGSYSGGGGSSDAEAAAPKLVITGYDTKPEKIMAGETFTLTVHIQNTSKSTSVCNGKFLIGNEAGTFLPTSGSNAVFIDKIPAGETGDLEIEMKTSADLAQKNYILVVKGDFDDGKGNNFTSSDNLSVPVYQEVKLGITDVSMTPEMIGIDSEGSLMFTINNQGNAGVYNVNVSVKDDAVTAEDSYVGNIAASSSAYATLNVVGAADNSDTGTIKVVISYEDSEGNTGEIEQDVACAVGEDMPMEEDGMDMIEEDEYDTSIPWWLILIVALVVAAVIAGVVVFLIIKRKKKLAQKSLEDDDDAYVEEDDDEEYEYEDGEDDIENEDF